MRAYHVRAAICLTLAVGVDSYSFSFWEGAKPMWTLRIVVLLEKAELEVLVNMADLECRPPREQIRWLFIQEARRPGLLAHETSSESQSGQEPKVEQQDNATQPPTDRGSLDPNRPAAPIR